MYSLTLEGQYQYAGDNAAGLTEKLYELSVSKPPQDLSARISRIIEIDGVREELSTLRRLYEHLGDLDTYLWGSGIEALEALTAMAYLPYQDYLIYPMRRRLLVRLDDASIRGYVVWRMRVIVQREYHGNVAVPTHLTKTYPYNHSAAVGYTYRGWANGTAENIFKSAHGLSVFVCADGTLQHAEDTAALAAILYKRYDK